MSKWAFALAAAVVVGVGCAGGGGGGTTTSGGTTGNTDSTAFVTIPNVPGLYSEVFLTGQGRAQGDLIAQIHRILVDDSNGTVQTVLNPFIRLQLNGYTQNISHLNVPTTVSRNFNHFNLEVQELDKDNGDGTFTRLGGGSSSPMVQQQFPGYFTVLPGRQTAISVRLDDSMFQATSFTFHVTGVTNAPQPGDTYTNNGFTFEVVSTQITNGNGTITTFGNGNPTSTNSDLILTTGSGDADIHYTSEQPGGYVFDPTEFKTVNYSINGLDPARMNGFLSDYLQFDLSNLTNGAADQPAFPDGSGIATALYVDGDNFAIGQLPAGPPDQAPPDPVPFYVLTPIGYVQGSDVGPRTAIDPATGRTIPIPGTYSLVQPNPQNPLNPATMITALQGEYKNYTKVINSVGHNPQGFEIIAFPGTYTDDSTELDYGKYDLVLFNISGGAITKMYFGQMDVIAGTLKAWPVAQVTNPSNVANEITGTVSGLNSNVVSNIHQGRYALNATNLPASFSASGRFIVYRR